MDARHERLRPERIGCSGGDVNRVKVKTVCSIALVLALALPGLLSSQSKITLAGLEASKTLGSRNAPITIEVFSDFQCPQCRIFYLTTTRQLIDNYVSTGKVLLVHRDFPLAMHPYSRDAARWANAAAAVGSGVFQTVETALYNKQDQWGATGRIEPVLAAALSPADMKRVQTIQINETAQLDAAIARDMAHGTTRRVNATPSIYVIHGGQTTPLPPGGVNYVLLKQYLDSLLKR